MTHFPDPVVPPQKEIKRVRQQRVNKLLGSCASGMTIRSTIIAIELAGVYYFGSSALLMDALSSIVDVISTLLLAICIKLAARPPDENHPFGHGRYEPLIGLLLGLMMVLVGGGALGIHLFYFTEANEAEVINPSIWMIPFIAVIMLEICYQIVMHAAKQQNSPALAADALHYRLDGLTSLFATIALALGAFIPEWSVTLDNVGALLIALLMVGIGLHVARQNLNQLLDHIPEEKYFERVRNAAKRAKGVLGTEKIRIQLYGPDAQVDIDIEVDPQHTVEVAHEISQKVRAEIQKEWPAVLDVVVHIEPFYPNDH